MTNKSPKAGKVNSGSRSRKGGIASRDSKKSEIELSNKNLGGTKGNLELDNTLPVTILVDGTVSPSDIVKE